MRYTLLEDRPPFKPSWRFRLWEFLIYHGGPLSNAIIVLMWVLFMLLVPFLSRGC